MRSEGAPKVHRMAMAIGVAIGLVAGSVATAAISSERGVRPAGATAAAATVAAAASGPPEVVGTSTPPASEAAAVVTSAPPQQASDHATPVRASAAAPLAASTKVSPAACAGQPVTGVRGVTDSSIRVGFALPDLRALEPLLGPQGHLGDQEKVIRAHLAGLHRRGLLPVCGRDIDPVFRSFNVLDPTQSRAVCQGFVQDDKVFAILVTFGFGDPNCVTQENRTFLMDRGLGLSQANFAAAGGRLFSFDPPIETAFRIWATWAAEKGYLKGRKVGVYYNNSNGADADRLWNDNVIAVLRKFGYEPVVVTTNTNTALAISGDPNDTVAVQRFKSAGVDAVFLKSAAFQNEAERQGYRPLYLEQGSDAKDASSGRYNPEHFDGALGVTWEHANEANTGMAPPPEAARCIREGQDAGIAPPHREWAEWDVSLLACDLLEVFVGGAHAAGRALTTERLVLGAETIKDLGLALMAPATYSRTKHWGVNVNRSNRYTKDCSCWRVLTEFEPLLLS